MRVQINIHYKKINLSLIPYLVRTMVIGYEINNQLVTYRMLHILVNLTYLRKHVLILDTYIYTCNYDNKGCIFLTEDLETCHRQTLIDHVQSHLL